MRKASTNKTITFRDKKEQEVRKLLTPFAQRLDVLCGEMWKKAFTFRLFVAIRPTADIQANFLKLPKLLSEDCTGELRQD